MRKNRVVAPVNSFIAAMNSEEHDVVPVWYMRQAGRYLPGYRKIRNAHSIVDICKRSDLTLQVTEEPINTLGVDAAIIFSDIILPARAMGFEVSLEEGTGPVVSNNLLQNRDLSGIHDFTAKDYDFATYSAMREFVSRRPETPIIGFSGGPITVASYLINGRPDHELYSTKKKMFSGEEGFRTLMKMVTEMIVSNCREQVRAGASAIQIFDSWAGFLSPYSLAEYASRYLSDIAVELSQITKSIYFSTQTGAMAEILNSAGFDFLSLDWRVNLSRIRSELGDSPGLQGNLDPNLIVDSPDQAAIQARRILDGMKGKTNYIFNLGHGVLPQSDPSVLKNLTDMVHSEVRV